MLAGILIGTTAFVAEADVLQTGSTGCGSTKPYPTIHFKTKGDRVIYPPGDSNAHVKTGLSTTNWTQSSLEGKAHGGDWSVYGTVDVSTGYTSVTCSAAG